MDDREQNEKDWTKAANRKNVDVTSFVKKLQAIRAGEQVEWPCPFCEGKVSRISQEGSHTLIGCNLCDMRITLDID